MRRTLLSLAIALGLTVAVAPPSFAIDPGLDSLLSARLANPRLGNHLGLIAIDAATGDVLSERDADALFLPASNMKLVTAASILARVSPDTLLTTRVAATAVPNEIILEGRGDPLLSDKTLHTLAVSTATTLQTGVPVVMHVDADYFPETKRAPGWTRAYLPYVVAPVQSLARLFDYSKDPRGNAARVFAAALRKQGFTVTIAAAAHADPAAPIVAEEGHSVGEAVKVMLRISENNVAEVLYRQAAIASGRPPTWSASEEAAKEALISLGIDATTLSLKDGSGVSRRDRLSPRALASLVRAIHIANPAPFATMFAPDAMPISGQTGTLDSRYGRFVSRQAKCAAGLVRAKTGTLFDTIALSGATTGASGERIFSIMVNDRPQRVTALATRQAVDGLAATINGCWAQ